MPATHKKERKKKKLVNAAKVNETIEPPKPTTTTTGNNDGSSFGTPDSLPKDIQKFPYIRKSDSKKFQQRPESSSDTLVTASLLDHQGQYANSNGPTREGGTLIIFIYEI